MPKAEEPIFPGEFYCVLSIRGKQKTCSSAELACFG